MLSSLEQALLGGMILFLMLGVGCSLSPNDFIQLLKGRRALSRFGVGLLAQYGAMPALAYFMVKFFGLPNELALGLIIVGCTPGGTTSNMFTYFARGNVELSVSLTLASSLMAFILMPLLLSFYAAGLTQNNLAIPYKNIVVTLAIAITPIASGMLVRAKSVKMAESLEKWANRLGHIIVLIMIVIWIPKMYQQVSEGVFAHYAAIFCLSFAGMLVGHLLGILFRQESEVRRAISFETGIQNAPLAFGIIALSFGEAQAQAFGWVALVYGALSVSNGINFVVFYRLFDHFSQRGTEKAPA